jgi:hypothetical protein
VTSKYDVPRFDSVTGKSAAFDCERAIMLPFQRSNRAQKEEEEEEEEEEPS